MPPAFCTAQVNSSYFPVPPGSDMPPVQGCKKQEYVVVCVIGVGKQNQQKHEHLPPVAPLHPHVVGLQDRQRVVWATLHF